MRIADQLKALQVALGPWAFNNGGAAFVVSDPSHLWEMAYAASSKLRVLILYSGEEIRGPFSTAAATHRVDRNFVVLVTRGRGFNADRGTSLTDTVGNDPPLFSLLEEGREIIRGMVNISVELPVDYKMIRPHSMGEVIMDAYSIEFSCATDLPEIVAVPSDQTAIPQ